MVAVGSRPAAARRGLSRFISQTEGLTADEACARAGVQLDFIAEDVKWELSGVLTALHDLVDQLDRPDRKALLARLFAQANEVFSAGATLGLDNIGAAAHSLCRLTDLLQTNDAWDKQAIALHLHALQYLHPDRGMTGEAAATLLSGLHEVTERVAKRLADKPAPPPPEEPRVIPGDRALLQALARELHLLRERNASVQELTGPILRTAGLNQSVLVRVQAVDLVQQTLDQLVLFIARYVDLSARNPENALASSIEGITLGELSRRLSEECLGVQSEQGGGDGVELFG